MLLRCSAIIYSCAAILLCGNIKLLRCEYCKAYLPAKGEASRLLVAARTHCCPAIGAGSPAAARPYQGWPRRKDQDIEIFYSCLKSQYHETSLRRFLSWLPCNFFSHKDLCCLQMLVCMALVPIFTFHVSVSDLHDPTIGLPILLQENRWTDLRNL
jgi:hypothetical protein